MPPVDRQGSVPDDFEVLITGFGPFATFTDNPSWLAIKDLHDTYLSTKERPQPLKKSSDDNNKGETNTEKEEDDKEKSNEEQGEEKKDDEPKEPRIHIQTVQSAVSYAHVLSLIPLIHGVNPSSPEAKVHFDPNGAQPDAETKLGRQGNGSPFPEGYSVQMPAKGKFDLVVHIGVGSRGAIVAEKLGHKRGYQIADVEGKKAPVATDQTPEKGHEGSEAGQREFARMNPADSSEQKDEVLRGFGKGYEDYEDEEHTSNDVTGLVEWLQTECNLKQTKVSHDAGRYLCDYIYYCSLCESKRRGAGTKVQFIHVPPVGEPQSSEDSAELIRNAVWWLICRNGRKS